MAELESRVTLMERDIAVLTRRFEDLETDVKALAPLVTTVAELAMSIGSLEGAVAGCRDSIGKVRSALESRDKTATEERRSVRIALIALTGVILAALIAAIATVAAAGLAR